MTTFFQRIFQLVSFLTPSRLVFVIFVLIHRSASLSYTPTDTHTHPQTRVHTYHSIAPLTNFPFLLISEYTTFANIIVDHQGFRRLFLDGHRYGVVLRKANEYVWRCTKNHPHKLSGKTTKCNGRLRTKMIDGYEMIQTPFVVHSHPVVLQIGK